MDASAVAWTLWNLCAWDVVGFWAVLCGGVGGSGGCFGGGLFVLVVLTLGLLVSVFVGDDSCLVSKMGEENFAMG